MKIFLYENAKKLFTHEVKRSRLDVKVYSLPLSTIYEIYKWWWLVDMMSARSVFHSKVWHFNFSGNRTPVLPSLAISPLTVVLLQAGIKLWCFPKETWPPKPPRADTIVPTLLQANEQWYRGSTLDRGKLSTEWAQEDLGP